MRRMLGVALVLALGCGDDKNNPTTGGGSSGGESTGTSEGTTTQTSNPTTTNSTDNSGTMGGSATMGTTTEAMTATEGVTTSTTETTRTAEPETTVSSSTSEGGSSGGSTGGGGGLEQQCMVACDKFIECQIGPEPDTCVQDCVMNFADSEGMCLAANEQMLACIGTMTCEQVVDFFQNDNPGPCADQLQQVAMACQGQTCEGSQGGNPQGTECSISVQCPNEPLLEMNCNKTECTCLIDGQPSGDPCPAENICKMPDALGDKANTCCGFMP